MVKFCEEDTNSISKGMLNYKADFVLDLHLTGLTVGPRVKVSLTDKCYFLTLASDCDGGSGTLICSHMAATSLYVKKKSMSKTNFANTRL